MATGRQTGKLMCPKEYVLYSMYIKIKVIPNSKKETFKKIDDETYRISVKEKAERNLANNRVLDILSLNLKIERNRLKIITGHHSSNKILFIEDL